MTRIAVIEDEPGIADFVSRGLGASGFDIVVAHDGLTGQTIALGDGVDLVVLDLMLPGRSGSEILRTLADERPGLPVIVLTARGELEERVAGLDAGAVDYVLKPFAFAELEARIRAQLRVARQATPTTLSCGALRLELLSRRVTVDTRVVHLSTTEFELLALLVGHQNELLSRPQILRAVWGYAHDPQTNIVDVYVGYLRRKLSAAGAAAIRITSVRSRGYRLEAVG